jgi:hypothetical protein
LLGGRAEGAVELKAPRRRPPEHVGQAGEHGLSLSWVSAALAAAAEDARRLKALEEENAKLKKLLAETILNNAILKDINNRKW